jgi:aryl-alcohol dehydrogenase-like predicted oxidoreductase
MKKVPLGNSGVEVSSYCLGAMYYGTRVDEQMSFRLLDQFVEAGGMFIDTANIYASWVADYKGGESETLLGKWLEARGNRDEIFIATKVGFQYGDTKRGLRASQIEAECEKSLKRLGIDTIDLYYAHVDDRNTSPEETLEAFDRLVKAGKARYIGASNFLAWRLEQAIWTSRQNAWPEYVCIQQRHTYLRPKPGATFDPQIAVNDDLLDYCRNQPITLLAYSSLLSGAYTRPERTVDQGYLGPDSDSRLAALNDVAAETGASLNQVILAWMLQGDPTIIPVMAASTPEQMDENLAALDLNLSNEQLSRLNNAGA